MIIYIILAVTFGFTLMLAEIAIGRRTGKSVIGAYSSINRHFSFLGWLAALVPVIITPYYCVIGGWVLKYLAMFLCGEGKSMAENDSFFNNFLGSAAQPTIFFIIFMAVTAIVVMLGVNKGIERIRCKSERSGYGFNF